MAFGADLMVVVGGGPWGSCLKALLFSVVSAISFAFAMPVAWLTGSLILSNAVPSIPVSVIVEVSYPLWGLPAAASSAGICVAVATAIMLVTYILRLDDMDKERWDWGLRMRGKLILGCVVFSITQFLVWSVFVTQAFYSLALSPLPLVIVVQSEVLAIVAVSIAMPMHWSDFRRWQIERQRLKAQLAKQRAIEMEDRQRLREFVEELRRVGFKEIGVWETEGKCPTCDEEFTNVVLADDSYFCPSCCEQLGRDLKARQSAFEGLAYIRCSRCGSIHDQDIWQHWEWQAVCEIVGDWRLHRRSVMTQQSVLNIVAAVLGGAIYVRQERRGRLTSEPVAVEARFADGSVWHFGVAGDSPDYRIHLGVIPGDLVERSLEAKSRQQGKDRCIVCGLTIRDVDKVVVCPHCLGPAHRRHFLEWLKVKASCPKCHSQVSLNDF